MIYNFISFEFNIGEHPLVRKYSQNVDPVFLNKASLKRKKNEQSFYSGNCSSVDNKVISRFIGDTREYISRKLTCHLFDQSVISKALTQILGAPTNNLQIMVANGEELW